MQMMNCFGSFPMKGHATYCVVELLDGTELKIFTKEDDDGSVLLEKVWSHLNLSEKEYFSLRFVNSASKTSFWLDGEKNIQKQLKRYGVKEPHPRFYFGVKFYAIDPCNLREEITRYLFFQQLRRDVASGRLPLSFNSLVELGALVAQSEYGDYNRRTHSTGYLQPLRLTADGLSDDLRKAITDLHRNKLRGVQPSQCELRYLDLIKQQDVYGVELYNAKGAANAEYKVGVSPHGVVIYRGKHRVALYHWPRIDSINFKSKELSLQVRDKHGSEVTEHSFTCVNTRVCKQLWKSCLEHHSFFRLSETKREMSAKSRPFQFGSRYGYSGRTEKEIASVKQRADEPTVNRPTKTNTTDAQILCNGNKSQSGGWVGNSTNTQPKTEGMFTSSNDSPGSVRSLKLKFQPKSSDFDPSLRRNGSRTARGHTSSSLDGDSLRQKRSHRRSGSRERKGEITPRNHSQAVAAAEADRQSSVNRIVRGYMPSNGNTSIFDKNDLQRHSDKQTSSKKREYENIVYNQQGLPVILATHKGEKADEKMPFYQQEWLQRTLQQRSTRTDHTRASRSSTKKQTPSDFYENDPLMYSILNPPTKEEIRKTSLSFYDDKQVNRDSGTDSPTCNQYDDSNVQELLRTLDCEHARLTKGDLSVKWCDHHHHSDRNHSTTNNVSPQITLI